MKRKFNLKLLKLSRYKYLNVFFAFLKIEIPGILQIFTLLAFLILISSNIYLRFIFIILVALLEDFYLEDKLLLFLNNERRYYLKDGESKKHKKTIIVNLLIYTKITSIILAGLTGIIGVLLPNT